MCIVQGSNTTIVCWSVVNSLLSRGQTTTIVCWSVVRGGGGGGGGIEMICTGCSSVGYGHQMK